MVQPPVYMSDCRQHGKSLESLLDRMGPLGQHGEVRSWRTSRFALGEDLRSFVQTLGHQRWGHRHFEKKDIFDL